MVLPQLQLQIVAISAYEGKIQIEYWETWKIQKLGTNITLKLLQNLTILDKSFKLKVEVIFPKEWTLIFVLGGEPQKGLALLHHWLKHDNNKLWYKQLCP